MRPRPVMAPGAVLLTELGQWTPLAQTVREWKATAAVHADPELVERLSSPLNDDFGAVPDPTED